MRNMSFMMTVDQFLDGSFVENGFLTKDSRILEFERTKKMKEYFLIAYYIFGAACLMLSKEYGLRNEENKRMRLEIVAMAMLWPLVLSLFAATLPIDICRKELKL